MDVQQEPQGSCKRIGALSYALVGYCRLHMFPQYVTLFPSSGIYFDLHVLNQSLLKSLGASVGSCNLQVYEEKGQRCCMTLTQLSTER